MKEHRCENERKLYPRRSRHTNIKNRAKTSTQPTPHAEHKTFNLGAVSLLDFACFQGLGAPSMYEHDNPQTPASNDACGWHSQAEWQRRRTQNPGARDLYGPGLASRSIPSSTTRYRSGSPGGSGALDFPCLPSQIADSVAQFQSIFFAVNSLPLFWSSGKPARKVAGTLLRTGTGRGYLMDIMSCPNPDSPGNDMLHLLRGQNKGYLFVCKNGGFAAHS